MFPVLFKEPLIREKVMSGKVLIQWRHSFCAELAKSRYMTKDSTKAAHIELANIFFSESNTDDSDEMSTSHSEKTGDYPSKTKAMMQQRDDFKFPLFIFLLLMFQWNASFPTLSAPGPATPSRGQMFRTACATLRNAGTT